MGGPSGVVASSGNEVYKTLTNNVNPSWIRDRGLRRLNFAIGAMFASAAANGYDGSLINGLLAMPYFNENLGDPASTLLGITLAGISLGGLPSFIPASYVSDYLGRRITVAIGSTLMLGAAVIQCATSGVYAFLGTRIMLGVGLGFAQTAAPPLTAEIAHPKHRANITNLFQAIWFWGAIVSAVMSLGFLFVDNHWSWRIPVSSKAFSQQSSLLASGGCQSLLDGSCPRIATVKPSRSSRNITPTETRTISWFNSSIWKSAMLLNWKRKPQAQLAGRLSLPRRQQAPPLNLRSGRLHDSVGRYEI